MPIINLNTVIKDWLRIKKKYNTSELLELYNCIKSELDMRKQYKGKNEDNTSWGYDF